MINRIMKISLGNLILIGMILGALTGIFLNLFIHNSFIKDLILMDNVFYFGGELFIRLIKMIVVPLVFTSIVMSLASISDIHRLGTIGLKAISIYIILFIISLSISFIISGLIKPGVGLSIEAISSTSNATTNLAITDAILNIIPENPVNALTEGKLLPTILFGVLIGYILVNLKKETKIVKNIFKEVNHVMEVMTDIVMKFAPVGIFCMMARTFGTMGFESILPMSKFIFSILVEIVILIFVVYPILLTVFMRINPLKFYKKYLPVMFFAFSSTSSNASIPLNIDTLERIGVSKDVSSFTIPLGTVINQNGAPVIFGTGIMFASQIYGIDFGISTLLIIAFTIFMASLSTPSVPMAGIFSLTVIFNSIGLPVNVIDLIMGMFSIIDMFVTLANVTGNGICTAIIAFFNDSFDVNKFNDN